MMTPDQSDADVMKYAMFGGSELTENDKLTQSMGEVDWSYLAPHYKSGSLYFVDPQLSLVEVGLAFTENRKDEVEATAFHAPAPPLARARHAARHPRNYQASRSKCPSRMDMSS